MSLCLWLCARRAAIHTMLYVTMWILVFRNEKIRNDRECRNYWWPSIIFSLLLIIRPRFLFAFFCLLFFYGLVSVFVCTCTCVCMGLRFSLLRLHHTHAKYLNCCAYLNHMQHIVRPSTCIYTHTQIRNAQKTIYSLAATIIIVTSWKYNSHRKEERER